MARYQETNVKRYVLTREDRVTRRLRAVFEEWAKKWAKAVRAAYDGPKPEKADKSTQAQVDAIITKLKFEDFSLDVMAELTPDLLRAFKQAGLAAIAQVGMTADDSIVRQLDAAALEYARSRSAELVGSGKNKAMSITETTRDRLRETIAGAVESGASTTELADALEESFSFSEARAAVISRTELASAHVQGNVQGWRETGMVTGKQSILGDLHDVEDECDECANAGVVDMDEDFIPGYDFPPYHPNCVCDVIPVLAEDRSND